MKEEETYKGQWSACSNEYSDLDTVSVYIEEENKTSVAWDEFKKIWDTYHDGIFD